MAAEEKKASTGAVVKGCLIFIVLGAVIIGACTGIIVACTDGETGSSPAPRPVATTTTQGEPETEGECPTAAERGYLSSIAAQVGFVAEPLQRLGRLLSLAGAEPAYMTNPEWRSEVDSELFAIETYARVLRETEPPTRRTRSVQSHIGTVVDRLAEADRLLHAGVIDGYDVRAVERSEIAYRAADAAMARAIDAVDALCR